MHQTLTDQERRNKAATLGDTSSPVHPRRVLHSSRRQPQRDPKVSDSKSPEGNIESRGSPAKAAVDPRKIALGGVHVADQVIQEPSRVFGRTHHRYSSEPSRPTLVGVFGERFAVGRSMGFPLAFLLPPFYRAPTLMK